MKTRRRLDLPMFRFRKQEIGSIKCTGGVHSKLSFSCYGAPVVYVVQNIHRDVSVWEQTTNLITSSECDNILAGTARKGCKCETSSVSMQINVKMSAAGCSSLGN